MSKQPNYADLLWDQMQDFVESWNKEAIRQETSNVYRLVVEDGDKPLEHGGSTIKYYKTMRLVCKTDDGEFQLYIAHAPLKNMTEASRSNYWKLQLLKDLMYQMFVNYTVMSHSKILYEEKSKKEVKQQIGSLTTLSGQPLTR